jgi:glycosyltransferase involved in cell wall biosynthesis
MILKTLTIGRRVDYILIDTYSTSAFWYSYITGLAANLLGKKYIPILHGGDLPSRLQRSKRACDRLFGNSHINVAVSGYLLKAFQDHKYGVTLIPNSIDLSKYHFKIREYPSPKILWVRAFARIYNPNMAIDVLVELQDTYPEAELCMVGPDKDGSMDKFREYARNRGVTNSIKITGKLSRENWICLSENYDFFINTTNVDNTPVSVIEAMALGLIIVSTDPGGLPFLLTKDIDSKLVRPGDASSMAAAIKDLIKNPSGAARLSQAARLKSETLSGEKIMDLWINLLS